MKPFVAFDGTYCAIRRRYHGSYMVILVSGEFPMKKTKKNVRMFKLTKLLPVSLRPDFV